MFKSVTVKIIISSIYNYFNIILLHSLQPRVVCIITKTSDIDFHVQCISRHFLLFSGILITVAIGVALGIFFGGILLAIVTVIRR